MNAAYPLFPVFVITILAYLTTWLFSRWRILLQKAHRKGWNYLLLITFLISGLLGLFSVVKINYHLEISNYEQLLRWHVSFGIAMVIIAVIHLSWHLKYYFGRSSVPAMNEEILNDKTPEPRAVSLLFLLGMVTIINQTIFIREFIGILSGNELIIGVVMASWLLLTGWGAFTARNKTAKAFTLKRGILLLVFTALLPVLLLSLLYWLKSSLFPPGTSIGLGISVLGVFIFLFPICFLSGFLFVLFTVIIAPNDHKTISRSYATEALGSLAGGLLFSVLLGRYFNSFQIIGVTASAILIASAFLFGKRKRYLLLSLGVLVAAILLVFNPDKLVRTMLFPNQEIVFSKSTRYGNLLVTQQAEQLNFYENNDLLFYTGNQQECEEAVHFAMLQHENPQHVLLISGGLTGMIKEIEKYPGIQITCLETNPELFEWMEKINVHASEETNVVFIRNDIRTFLISSKQQFDVILMNLPAPSSLSLNRFYSDEFFQLVAYHCNPNSVVSSTLPSTANYASDEAIAVNSSLWKTMGKHFSNQLMLTGEKNYFLASNAPLSPSIAGLAEERGIENTYVNHFYINDSLHAERSQALLAQFDNKVPINKDYKPFLFLNQINQWLNLWKTNYWIIVLVPVLLFLVLFFLLKPVSKGLYIGGFTSASLEVVLLLAYQLQFGSIYQATSLFFAVFMGGLAAGNLRSFPKNEKSSMKSFALLQYSLALFALLFPLIMKGFGLHTPVRWLVQSLFFILTFVLSFGIGREYRIASHLRSATVAQTTGINYSSDLLGSAFGAFITSIFLFPLLGLVFTCWIVAFLNLVSGSFAIFRQTD